MVGGNEGGSGPGDEQSLPTDTIFELLANQKRRDICRYFSDRGEQTTHINDLVDYICDQQTEQTGERPTSEDVKAILLHLHLPKLVETGLVDFDERNGTVRYYGDERLEEIFRVIQEEFD